MYMYLKLNPVIVVYIYKSFPEHIFKVYMAKILFMAKMVSNIPL